MGPPVGEGPVKANRAWRHVGSPSVLPSSTSETNVARTKSPVGPSAPGTSTWPNCPAALARLPCQGQANRRFQHPESIHRVLMYRCSGAFSTVFEASLACPRYPLPKVSVPRTRLSRNVCFAVGTFSRFSKTYNRIWLVRLYRLLHGNCRGDFCDTVLKFGHVLKDLFASIPDSPIPCDESYESQLGLTFFCPVKENSKWLVVLPETANLLTTVRPLGTDQSPEESPKAPSSRSRLYTYNIGHDAHP
nr:hypothetical protein Iba_chr08aCG11180 [Ipomoea batatas]